mmetsp:Transcript_38130/g.96448  ORF Transcript_38130/g.96448 Transcript_38130/m.96448 type:complete len:230 (+) Transcript_38130:490-1179(+)
MPWPTTLRATQPAMRSVNRRGSSSCGMCPHASITASSVLGSARARRSELDAGTSRSCTPWMMSTGMCRAAHAAASLSARAPSSSSLPSEAAAAAAAVAAAAPAPVPRSEASHCVVSATCARRATRNMNMPASQPLTSCGSRYASTTLGVTSCGLWYACCSPLSQKLRERTSARSTTTMTGRSRCSTPSVASMSAALAADASALSARASAGGGAGGCCVGFSTVAASPDV